MHNLRLTSLAFKSLGSKAPCFWIILKACYCLEMAWQAALSAGASFFYVQWGYESFNASKWSFLKGFSLPSRENSSTSNLQCLKQLNQSRTLLHLHNNLRKSFEVLNEFQPRFPRMDGENQDFTQIMIFLHRIRYFHKTKRIRRKNITHVSSLFALHMSKLSLGRTAYATINQYSILMSSLK